MKVLITGITGFAGSHLADYILGNHSDFQIFGTARYRSRLDNIEHILNKITLFDVDFRDQNSIVHALKVCRPDMIFHLAAMSYVPTSWKAPAATIENNVIGQINLFEAVRQICPGCRIQVAGSSEEYGLVFSEEVPITENNPLRPLSPYGVSKVAQDLLGYQYFKSYGMWIVRTRAFNHTGPRRGDLFVSSNFAKQLIQIESGIKAPILSVGNLAAIRDFTDVRDTVRAYWLVLNHSLLAGHAINIGSGKGQTIKAMLEMLCSLSKNSVEIAQDPERTRPSDVPVLICDNTKLCTFTIWKPEIPFEKTLEDLLQYWRQRSMREICLMTKI